MFKSVRSVMLATITLVSAAGVTSADVGGTHLPAKAGASPVAQIAAPAMSPEALTALAATKSICANAHVANIGWQGWRCANQSAFLEAGTTGQGLSIQAVAVVASGTGGFCVQAHVENQGWQSAVCGAEGDVHIVGTTGLGLAMQAFAIIASESAICTQAHVANLGWLGVFCADAGHGITVGTTGQGLGMQALQLAVF